MKLNTTNLHLEYQEGYLTCIRYGDEEILRRIYPSLRNQEWFTVPMNIKNEKININEHSFSIVYTGQFVLENIFYEAEVEIMGLQDDSITFQFKGRALSDFLKNRIGICVHHPITECLGQPVVISSSDGSNQDSNFPVLIDPGVIFTNIQSMCWWTPNQVKATLEFEGDEFESEDQRNWSDASFKTYSTPVHFPFPVQVRKGDDVYQKITLRIDTSSYVPPPPSTPTPVVKFPFPKLGFSRSGLPMDTQEIDLLRQLIFDHYRVVVDFSPGWSELIDQAHTEAQTLQTTIELVVFFDNYEEELIELKTKLNPLTSSMIIMQKKSTIVDQLLLDHVLPILKKECTWLKIGTGTNGHFVDVNRHRNFDPSLDFICYGSTPEAHLTDDRVLIENLEAFKYPIQTIQSFSDLAIHISPVTLKSRDYPKYTIDHRQHSTLAANWVLICLKYTAGVNQITLFETNGAKGIINETGTSPVYDVLRRISEFKPKFIKLKEVENPLLKDVLILENERGESLELIAVF